MARGFFKEKFETVRDASTIAGIRKPKNAYDVALTRSSEENKEIFIGYEKLQNQIKEQIKSAKPEQMTSEVLKRMSEKLKEYEEKSGGIMDAEQRRAQTYQRFSKKAEAGEKDLGWGDIMELPYIKEDAKDVSAGVYESGINKKEQQYANTEQEDALRENALLSDAQARVEKSKKSAEEAKIVAEKDAQDLEAVRRRIQGLGPEKREAE